MQITAEILCLGNELLIGRTVNTNANFLAKRLSQYGIKVERIITIRDEFEEAVGVIEEILQRQPSILCITGGLGPTHDDIQLEVVAQALGVPLGTNDEALEIIKRRYKELNQDRRKMAMLPSGSRPLKNAAGSAPGVFSRGNGVIIFSLPGVPKEMKSIMDGEVIPLLSSELGIKPSLAEYGIDVRGVRESDIGRLTDEVRRHFPEVLFKSHPREDDNGYYLSLHTYSLSGNDQEVRQALITWVEELEKQYSLQKSTVHPVINDSVNDDQE